MVWWLRFLKSNDLVRGLRRGGVKSCSPFGCGQKSPACGRFLLAGCEGCRIESAHLDVLTNRRLQVDAGLQVELANQVGLV